MQFTLKLDNIISAAKMIFVVRNKVLFRLDTNSRRKEYRLSGNGFE